MSTRNIRCYVLFLLITAFTRVSAAIDSETTPEPPVVPLPVSPASFTITNVSIFDGHEFHPGSHAIVVSAGLIEKVIFINNGSSTAATGTATGRDDVDASNAIVIDGRGGTLLPGLIDSHVHIDTPSAPLLDGLRRQGVTTAMDCGCFLGDDHTACDALNLARLPRKEQQQQQQQQRKRQQTSSDHGSSYYNPPWPELFFSYTPAAGSQSAHARIIGAERTLATAADAAAWVVARAGEPSRFVKLILSAPEPGLDAATAWQLASGAHAAGKRTVVCHATEPAAVTMALEAGCDQLHHAPLRTALDGDLAQRIRDAGAVVAPTLVQMEGITASTNAMWTVWAVRRWRRWVTRSDTRPDASLATAMASVKRLHAAGVPLLVGTDATGQDFPVFGSVGFHDGFRRELALLSQAGVPPLDILRGATSLPARHFGLPDRGEIAPGRRADLVLVRGSPFFDGKETSSSSSSSSSFALQLNVVNVWIGGETVTEDPDDMTGFDFEPLHDEL